MTRYFALIVGLVFLVAGVVGFIPGAIQPPPATDVPLSVDLGYGYVLGLFPVNIVIDVFYLGVGILGLLAFSDFHRARTFAQVLAVIFAVLALMGIPAALNTVFGIAPIFGNAVWLHGIVAVIAAFFGWVSAEEPSPIRTS